MTEAILALTDLVVMAAYVVAIALALLKGRPMVALLGLVVFVTGAAISFAIFQQVREGLIDDWVWWLFALHGAAVAGLLLWVAMRSARPGSWWDRRRERSAFEPTQ